MPYQPWSWWANLASTGFSLIKAITADSVYFTAAFETWQATEGTYLFLIPFSVLHHRHNSPSIVPQYYIIFNNCIHIQVPIKTGWAHQDKCVFPRLLLEDSVIYAVTWAGISILQEISLLRSTTQAFCLCKSSSCFLLHQHTNGCHLPVGSRCIKLTGSLIKTAFYYWGAPSVHSACASGGGAVSLKHCPVNFQQVGIQLETETWRGSFFFWPGPTHTRTKNTLPWLWYNLCSARLRRSTHPHKWELYIGWVNVMVLRCGDGRQIWCLQTNTHVGTKALLPMKDSFVRGCRDQHHQRRGCFIFQSWGESQVSRSDSMQVSSE